MTQHVYQYRMSAPFITADLARRVHSSAVFTDAAGGLVVRVGVDDTKLTDMDEFMALKGFVRFGSADPAGTPASEVRLADGTVLAFVTPADGEFVKRSGSTLIGGTGGSFDQRDTIVYDHFIVASLTAERMGMMGWNNLVSGTGSDFFVTGEAGHPGIIDFGCGTATAGRASLYMGDSNFPGFLLNATQNQLDLEWLIRFNAAALSSSNMERFAVGFGDNWGAAAGTVNTNCICAEFNPAANANWRLMTANSGAETRTTSSGSNPTSATWYRVGIRMTYPGGVPTANLLINGTVVASHTTNIPATTVNVGIRMDSNAGTEPRYQIDYVICTQITYKET